MRFFSFCLIRETPQVPDPISANLDRLQLEVDSEGADVVLAEGVLGESKQDTRLAAVVVAHDHDLE